MNFKFLSNIIVYAAGTIILVVLGSIVTYNFLRDSRVMDTAYVKAETDTSSTNKENKAPEPTPKKFGGIDDGINNTGGQPKSTSKNNEPKATPSEDKKKPVSKGIKVEVINYSGIKRVAESIRELLEAEGYEVSAGNGSSSTLVQSEIINRNDKKAASAIRAILKFGKIKKIPEPGSKYDVTVIIGDDYKP